MRAVAAEAIARGTVPLLSFADFVGRMFTPDGRFESALAHDPDTFAGTTPFFLVTFGHLPKTLAASSTFLFFRTSVEMGTGRGP
jgi:hypothetical protein